MKNLFIVISLGGLLACQGQEPKHRKEHAPGTANEYMHQSSVNDLASRFESPERDAYQKPEKVLSYLGNISGKKIMDIGSGSGYFSVKMAKKGARVIAADVNDEFQALIKERIEGEKIENLTTRKIPYDSPGLEDNEVDMVLMVNTYHHIENRPEYFAKVKNGLKSRGELVIIDFFDAEIPVGPRHHKIPIDTVISELKKAGYTHFQVEVNLLPYQYIIRCKMGLQ
ncbi:class I SAM-dependent methyltransferase [Lentiprolixibacter aurantiacus]|uniref:Class I SAM-dependent methyltransferase n=1 Tax=Lentiprolixibacter aurantiacus TaxID=2993939 RepID=A0AAE3SM32_9FLAO|nr:class I SAM-dependent methyltransferase [Lentiprolixibacter aurantiacus]MCX2718020.1 class I SAM-dependent methyltransferase [Lentiprolixibacter aurantiacus]